MRLKTTVVFLAAVLLSGCLSAPSGEAPGLDEVVERWIKGLREENIELLMSTYWPEAELLMPQAEGGEQRLRGSGEIRRMQQSGFDLPMSFSELRVAEADRQVAADKATVRIHVGGADWTNVNILELERRADEWRIIHQVLEPLAAGEAEEEPVPVVSALQAWADGDGSGTLEPPEARVLRKAILRLVRTPHPAENPLDAMFDANGDRRIERSEGIAAGHILVDEQIKTLYRHDPEQARRLDPNGDGWLMFYERHVAFAPVVFDELPPGTPNSQIADSNGDGQIDDKEKQQHVARIVGIVMRLPFGPEETRQYQWQGKAAALAWIDTTGDGQLEEQEAQELGARIFELLDHEGPLMALNSPLAGFFDWNRDGWIDSRETQRARDILYEQQLERLGEVNVARSHGRPHRSYVDLNQNGRIDNEERKLLTELFFSQPSVPERNVITVLDRRLDQNGDGRLDGSEQHHFESTLFANLTIAWLKTPGEAQAPGKGWPVAGPLEELADLNGDGFVDATEDRQAFDALAAPHPAQSPFDKRIDFNRNGQVEGFEIREAQRAGEVATERFESLPPLLVVTLIDGYLDLNGDRRVEQGEIDRLAQAFLQPLPARFPGRWQELLDTDKDGWVGRNEAMEARERYLRPHPVRSGSAFDAQLNRNADGFVGPEEIGIAAGRSPDRTFATFDERLEREQGPAASVSTSAADTGKEGTATRFESEYYKRLGLIQDKKLAVVGITSGTRNVDQETAGGVMVFIENAFVNVGKVRVVDRQNIARIVKEYEFQQSQLTDETTAVRIGKLSGADIIVIGSISYVGERYYLNIKLISVEIGEIIGSSIAGSAQASEFYDMCNEAVYRLF